MIVTHSFEIGNVERDFQRLGGGFGPDDILRFEALAASAFALTQAAVHVITGSLKATGDYDTDLSTRRNRWTATIHYGSDWEGRPAPIPGPWRARRPPSEYARYEQRRPGHDWMEPINHTDRQWVLAMMAYLRGET